MGSSQVGQQAREPEGHVLRGATSLRIHEARVLAPECDDGRSRFRASRVANVEESQDESMGVALAQASADPALTRPAAEA